MSPSPSRPNDPRKPDDRIPDDSRVPVDPTQYDGDHAEDQAAEDAVHDLVAYTDAQRLPVDLTERQREERRDKFHKRPVDEGLRRRRRRRRDRDKDEAKPEEGTGGKPNRVSRADEAKQRRLDERGRRREQRKANRARERQREEEAKRRQKRQRQNEVERASRLEKAAARGSKTRRQWLQRDQVDEFELRNIERAERDWDSAMEFEPTAGRQLVPFADASGGAFAPARSWMGPDRDALWIDLSPPYLDESDRPKEMTPQAAIDRLSRRRGPRMKAGQEVAHLMISWSADHEPTAEEYRTASRRYLHRVGLDPDLHDAIAVAHFDEAHPHIHVMVARTRSDGAVWHGFGVDRALQLEEALMRQEAGEDINPPMVGRSKVAKRVQHLMAKGRLEAELRLPDGTNEMVPMQGDAVTDRLASDITALTQHHIGGGVAKLVGYRSAKRIVTYVIKRSVQQPMAA